MSGMVIGPVQREVLQELMKRPRGEWVWAYDVAAGLVGGTPRPSDLQRVRRAIHLLAGAGHVEEDRHRVETAGGGRRWGQVARIPDGGREGSR
jgi:hypothetical protein